MLILSQNLKQFFFLFFWMSKNLDKYQLPLKIRLLVSRGSFPLCLSYLAIFVVCDRKDWHVGLSFWENIKKVTLKGKEEKRWAGGVFTSPMGQSYRQKSDPKILRLPFRHESLFLINSTFSN